MHNYFQFQRKFELIFNILSTTFKMTNNLV